MTVGTDILPDLLTSQLREIIADPDRYTPEAVHAAARELAARAAVPRYYGRLRGPAGDSPVVVVQRTKLDLGTWTRVLFSESRLRAFSGLLAILYLLEFVDRIFHAIGEAHRIQVLLRLPIPWTFYLRNGSTILSALLLFLFFGTLRQTLATRGVPHR